MNMIYSIIFDWKRTLYDPDSKTLINGAKALLAFCKGKNIPMILVGKGGEDMQQEVDRLGVLGYFREIVFAEGEKDPQVFKKYFSSDPKKTIFIGDRNRSELEIGKKLGATTIWVKQGKFSVEEPENENQKPDYTVLSLHDCIRQLQVFLLSRMINFLKSLKSYPNQK